MVAGADARKALQQGDLTEAGRLAAVAESRAAEAKAKRRMAEQKHAAAGFTGEVGVETPRDRAAVAAHSQADGDVEEEPRVCVPMLALNCIGKASTPATAVAPFSAALAPTDGGKRAGILVRLGARKASSVRPPTEDGMVDATAPTEQPVPEVQRL